MGQRAIIGQQQQPLAVLVQTAHRKQPPPTQLRRQQIQYGFLTGILSGRENAGGLVEHYIGKFPDIRLLSVHQHPRKGGVQLLLRSGGWNSVHQHAPFFHQLPDLPARPAACRCQQFIQSLHSGLPSCFLMEFSVADFPGKRNGKKRNPKKNMRRFCGAQRIFGFSSYTGF